MASFAAASLSEHVTEALSMREWHNADKPLGIMLNAGVQGKGRRGLYAAPCPRSESGQDYANPCMGQDYLVSAGGVCAV